MELPLFAQVALGVAFSLALWAGAKTVWVHRVALVDDLKSFGEVLLKISFFAALTVLFSLLPGSLSVWWGWVQLAVCALVAVAWGAFAASVIIEWKNASVHKVLVGLAFLAVALVPATRVILHLPELSGIVLRFAGLDWGLA